MLVIIGTGVAMGGLPNTQNFNRLTAEATSSFVGTAGDHDEEKDARDSRGEGGGHEDGIAEELHEAAANLLYGLIFESRRQRRNLALAMLPGQR
jgi:cytochrome b